MKKHLTYHCLFLFFVGNVVFLSCKKKEEVHKNPFDDESLKAPEPVPSSNNPSPTSFEYLYKNVFKPTCANSGCHDGGMFDPDFRTISSSYNGLVYAPVIKTPTNIPYTYRVLPGNADLSILKHRLIQFPGSGIGTLGQGRMPWNDTNWRYVSTNATYIQNITDWINGGAKDVFGNSPTLGNKNPNTLGFKVCNAGNAASFPFVKYIEVPRNNGPVDLWFYVVDDITPPQNMVSSEVKLSRNRNDFSNAVTAPLAYVSGGNTYQDITQTNNVKYNFKLSNFNLNSVADTFIFVRTYIKDPDHASPSETPNSGSNYYINNFVIKLIP
jgi:hypothetical protein